MQKSKILSLSLILFLASCGHIYIAEERREPPLFRVHEITVKMVFVDKEKLAQIDAPGVAGVYYPERNTFYCLQPRSWDDLKRLAVIGHEILHASGYNHDPDSVFGDCEPLADGTFIDY